ncbi:hypothetical protein L596_028198 [Steinernema carpocapsae]|uniref:BAG domain-containing protein n=1 Tax=Steinernema carpocapsae TaxID=34508 RepID=A0A4U5LXS4_STECR|nr:hypothetical protein L596_028198 [Steinernema carpocapsae]
MQRNGNGPGLPREFQQYFDRKGAGLPRTSFADDPFFEQHAFPHRRFGSNPRLSNDFFGDEPSFHQQYFQQPSFSQSLPRRSPTNRQQSHSESQPGNVTIIKTNIPERDENPERPPPLPQQQPNSQSNLPPQPPQSQAIPVQHIRTDRTPVAKSQCGQPEHQQLLRNCRQRLRRRLQPAQFSPRVHRRVRETFEHHERPQQRRKRGPHASGAHRSAAQGNLRRRLQRANREHVGRSGETRGNAEGASRSARAGEGTALGYPQERVPQRGPPPPGPGRPRGYQRHHRSSSEAVHVEVVVNTPRNQEQAQALSAVNNLIEGAVVKMQEDLCNSKETVQRYLNACNPEMPEGPIDQRFQAQVIECTADDQKKIRRKLANIIQQIDRAQRTCQPSF